MDLRQFHKELIAGAWWNVGWALRCKGDKEKAKKCFVKALTVNPDPNLVAWNNIGLSIEKNRWNLQTVEELKQKIGVIVED